MVQLTNNTTEKLKLLLKMNRNLFEEVINNKNTNLIQRKANKTMLQYVEDIEKEVMDDTK